jgi:hypothetical protein
MTRTTKNGDRIGRLLRLAGPRPIAPHDSEERVRNAVHDVWRESVQGRQRRRFLVRSGFALAAAASIVAMVGLLWQPTIVEEPVFVGSIGRVEAVKGSVWLKDPAAEPGSKGLRLSVGDEVPAGMVVDTGVLGRAALRLTSGSSLRLDRLTRLQGVSDTVVALEAGALYFDSGATDAAVEASLESTQLAASQVEVRTELGVVQDIGTQFEVRLVPSDAERAAAAEPGAQMRVRVREGLVNLDRNGESYDAGAGVELMVDSGGDLSRRQVAVFGPDWEWILTVAPPFEIEGSTLQAFLGWVSRETGLQPSFADADTEGSSSEVVLHGSILGMRPDQALEAVLPTCRLEHRLDSGILVIEAEGP